jgi:hypothetical protein
MPQTWCTKFQVTICRYCGKTAQSSSNSAQGFVGLTLGFSNSWAYGKWWPCFPKVLPRPAKPDPYTPCGWSPLMSLACGWYYWRSGFTYGVGLRLPHAMRTARSKMFRLDRGLKAVVVQTKYDSPKVTIFSQCFRLIPNPDS